MFSHTPDLLILYTVAYSPATKFCSETYLLTKTMCKYNNVRSPNTDFRASKNLYSTHC